MIPTAEEVLKLHYNMDRDEDGHPVYYDWSVKDAMIEFAKLHVEAALKEALDNIPCLGSSTDIASWQEVEDAVLNAYPLENIK